MQQWQIFRAQTLSCVVHQHNISYGKNTQGQLSLNPLSGKMSPYGKQPSAPQQAHKAFISKCGMMGDPYQDTHSRTQGRNKSKRTHTHKMPHSLAKADKQTHALTSSVNNQLWNLLDKSPLFPKPGVMGAIIFQSA